MWILIIIILYLRWALTGKLSSTPTFFQGLCNSVINGKAAAENVEKSGEKKPCRGERGGEKEKFVVIEFGFLWLAKKIPAVTHLYISMYVCSPLITCWATESVFCLNPANLLCKPVCSFIISPRTVVHGFKNTV